MFGENETQNSVVVPESNDYRTTYDIAAKYNESELKPGLLAYFKVIDLAFGVKEGEVIRSIRTHSLPALKVCRLSYSREVKEYSFFVESFSKTVKICAVEELVTFSAEHNVQKVIRQSPFHCRASFVRKSWTYSMVAQKLLRLLLSWPVQTHEYW